MPRKHKLNRFHSTLGLNSRMGITNVTVYFPTIMSWRMSLHALRYILERLCVSTRAGSVTLVSGLVLLARRKLKKHNDLFKAMT